MINRGRTIGLPSVNILVGVNNTHFIPHKDEFNVSKLFSTQVPWQQTVALSLASSTSKSMLSPQEKSKLLIYSPTHTHIYIIINKYIYFFIGMY